ncbi:MAG: CBS domain-containing protein [Candidatus Bathyarchaeia archaeon]
MQIAINEQIKAIMTKNVISVKTSAEIDEAIKLMKENNIGGLPVTDEENRVRAIITERDVSNLFVDKLSEISFSHNDKRRNGDSS